MNFVCICSKTKYDTSHVTRIKSLMSGPQRPVSASRSMLSDQSLCEALMNPRLDPYKGITDGSCHTEQIHRLILIFTSYVTMKTVFLPQSNSYVSELTSELSIPCKFFGRNRVPREIHLINPSSCRLRQSSDTQ